MNTIPSSVSYDAQLESCTAWFRSMRGTWDLEILKKIVNWSTFERSTPTSIQAIVLNKSMVVVKFDGVCDIIDLISFKKAYINFSSRQKKKVKSDYDRDFNELANIIQEKRSSGQEINYMSYRQGMDYYFTIHLADGKRYDHRLNTMVTDWVKIGRIIYSEINSSYFTEKSRYAPFHRASNVIGGLIYLLDTQNLLRLQGV